ncbi:MAG: DNA methyltransferase [Cytophagales bacterium]|nr:DNA methyltransferase [Cytophagales bacterium]
MSVGTLNVFSSKRTLETPNVSIPGSLKLNQKMTMDGSLFLSMLPKESVTVAFLDPQYRGVLDKMNYGNEGKGRAKARCSLQQMDDQTIHKLIKGISNALIPSGHLFLWIDKFHLCTGFRCWLNETPFDVVDMITWDKMKIGMGYRTRRKSEHLIVLQKTPRKAKGVWQNHKIPDVWAEEVKKNGYAHRKPVGLQGKLLAAVSNSGDIVIDPAAGSFSVLEACQNENRNFLGCDINGSCPS